MTFVDAMLAIWRRWYVLALALAVAGAGFVMLDAHGGLYSSKPIIQFMRPGASILEIYNGLDNEDIIGFAQIVAEAVNNGHPIERYALDEAPLYGAGLRQQVRVGVPNTGGQWGTSYSRAEIAISVVGTSRAWVQDTQRVMITRVLEAARASQDALNAPENDRVSYAILPASTTIEHITSLKSTRAAALAAMMGAGTLVGAWCALTLDRWLLRRRHDPPLRRQKPLVVGEGEVG
ncbi:hypothetical protein [Xylanimonas sp. McL0601]|uniref:hypothetical protein n=1 Tax=Xylanimonas sp. McL0601 TaxID=3414739 RepID=UPI003CEEAC11